MFCKLQHGKIERIWYLQIIKGCQVVEFACLDWCNLIRTQMTTKYKIRNKYKDDLRPNKYKESRKTTFVLPEPTYRRTKVKRREKQKANNGPDKKTKVWATGTPWQLEFDTKTEDGK